MKAPETNPEQQFMDPKRKEGQGLDLWAKNALERGMISEQTYKDFVEKNNLKQEQLEKRGLPHLRSFGVFSSIEEMQAVLEPHKEERFIIRCVQKNKGNVKRLIAASYQDILKFASELDGGISQWDAEVKETVETVASGTIIVGPTGKTLIETWERGHQRNVTNDPKIYAEYDPDKFDTSFKWHVSGGTQDAEQLKTYAVKALKYLFPNLKPKPNDPIYAEYGIRPEGGVYFIEASDSPFLTGGLKPRK